MGTRALLVVLVSGAVAIGTGPAAAPAAAACDQQSGCGVPTCTTAKVPVRPDMARDVTVWCTYADSATVLQQPAHGTVANLTAQWGSLRFTVHMAPDAPRDDEAVLEVVGPEGTIQSHVTIQTIPTSENSAPVCFGDRLSQRSDGNGSVDLYLHAWCSDPDGDEFTMEGSGPGTHLDAPLLVPAGQGNGNWRYRTATWAGSETTYVWATDILGARSANAQIDVTVGPDVDTLPSCQPNPTWGAPGAAFPVYMRPGAVRRFGIICTDPDSDPFTAAVTTPPAHGALAAFDLGSPDQGWWGTQQWIDATYVPDSTTSEPDEFAVTASGSHGAGPNVRIAMTPRVPPENSGGSSCGWSGLWTTVDTPGTLTARCDDTEGDPLHVTVLTEPLHGTAGAPVVTPDRFGQSRFDIPYVPNPGYKGYDCVKIRIEDDYGASDEITLDINVTDFVPPPPVFLPPLPVPLPPIVVPPATPPAATSAKVATALVRAAATRALGTTGVRRLRGGTTQVWVPSELSKRTLVRHGEAPAAFVLCSQNCRMRSQIGLAGRRFGVAKTHSLVTMTPWQPRLIALAVTARERRALRAALRSRARLEVVLRSGAAKPVKLSRVIAITG